MKRISTNLPTATHTKTVTFDLNEFATEWNIKQDKPGDSIITLVTTPIDIEADITLQSRKVANAYAGSSIPTAMRRGAQLPGARTYASRKEVWTVSDSEDSDFRYDIPVSGSMTLNIPLDTMVTTEMLQAFAFRVAASYFSSTGSFDINTLLRGVTIPPEMR